MTGSHADREAIIYREMLEISGLPALFLVYDAIAVNGFSFSARRQLVKIDKELRPHRIWYFSCLPGLLRTLFSVYKALVPAAAHNMSFFPNWGEALAACLDGNMIPYSKENMEPGFLPDQELKVLKSLSRTEMETLALELIRSNHEAQEARRRESQILFDAISRIAWDENLPPVRVPDNYEGDDEFIKVITALSVLQKDLVEMTRELVELNQNLEEKVVARTREISAKEANLVALVENTDDMILSVDKDLRILVINRAYQDYLNRNFKVELKQGDHLLEGTPETRALFWLPSFKKALKGEKVQLLTSRTFSGEDYSLQISMNPIREPSGEVDGVCVYIRDVSEFKLAETKVREHEQMLNTISENINEGIFRVSANDRFLFVNRAFARLFGYENPENLIGQRTADLYVSNQRRLEILEMIRKDGAFANEEVEFVCRDGRTFWGLLNGVISIDSKERFYLDAAIRDITEQRSVEKVLKEQNEALLKVNSELDSFVYSTSHDLRAPLVSLSGLIHILREEKDVDQQKRYLGLMDESIRKMEEFIIDILTYSRNTRQEVEVRKIQFDQLISQVFDGLKFMKSYKTIRINTVIDQAIPFYSDPRRMASLLRNLISNALRYYDPEKEAPFVEVEVNVGKEKARIEVRDNGIGIAKEYQDKIFGMFFRASSMSKGSGLGLYIVKETLEKLGGTVSVDSELGKGTTIRIEVPARQVS
jgi:PAS domain S-box-containing protein